MKITQLFTCLLALMVSSSVFGTDPVLPEGMTKISSVEGITEYQMPNGLRVLLFPDQSKPTITVNITYMVGSRHEGYGETGMAHLLEHLVFKGTPNHPDIPSELTEHGARPNGTTWYDRTNYFETFNASDENLKWALDLESDRMINSFIAKKDLDSEMTVVRNEFERGENSPGSVLFKRTTSSAFLWHNYGNSTIGARADIENVPIDKLKAFYKKYYQPDNAILMVAGKIDEEKTLQLISDYFGKIPKPERELIKTYTKEPTQDGERLITLRRNGDVQALSCVYHTAPGSHPDYASVAVISELLTSEPNGRLFKSLVETKKASSVWSFAPGLREGGFIYIGADVRMETDLEDSKNNLLSSLDSLITVPPSNEEVERAKSKLLKDWELAYNDSGRVGLRMSESIAAGDWRLFFLYRDALEKVTPEDVVSVAERYFVPSNRTIGMFIPDKDPVRAEIPDGPVIEDLVKDYKGREVTDVAEAFDPSPDNIESRVVRGELPNGAEYSFLTKKNRGNAVSATFGFRMGNYENLVNKQVVGSLASSMLDKGTQTLSQQEITDKLDALKANVRISGGADKAFVRIETIRENLPEVIALIGDMMKNPAMNQEEFDIVVQEKLARLEESLSDPQALASQALRKAMNAKIPKDDPRYSLTMEEQIAALKTVQLEDVKDFHNHMYGANEASFSIVGDFDEDTVKKTIESEFNDWTYDYTYERLASEYTPNPAEDVDIETPDKANSMFFAGLELPINDGSPDYEALVIGNYMLGGGFINSRLAKRIRQEEGLSYGVGSWFNASSQDDNSMFGAYAISAPENTAKVQKAFKEVIAQVQSEGFTQEELDAARTGWLQQQMVSRSQDNELMSTLSNCIVLDRTMDWYKNMESKLAGLSVDDVNKAVAKYIDPDKMVYVKAGDFAKVRAMDKKP